MPNHCHNDLYISGPESQVDALLLLVGALGDEPKFDFNAIIKYPAQFAERDADAKELDREKFEEKYGPGARDGYNSGGYEWCGENWGTKWNAYEVERRDYDRVCVTFQTAWCPPSLVIIELHKQFPTLTLQLEYFETGMAQCGGFALRAEDEWYEEAPWAPGIKQSEWRLNFTRTQEPRRSP